jgi:low temperature requirement protein LtrA
LLGVITTAAGIERSIGRAGERLDDGSALLLAAGVAMYLVGDVAFRTVMGIRPIALRAGAAAVALGTFFLGTAVAAGVQLITLVLVVIAALAAESRRRAAVQVER